MPWLTPFCYYYVFYFEKCEQVVFVLVRSFNVGRGFE
jgi:hypothetical protein